MKMRFLYIIILLLFASFDLLSQVQSTTEYTDYRRNLKKEGSNAVESPGGLLMESSSCVVGREPGPIKWRAVYQWNLPDNLIPDGSEINLIRLTIGCTQITATQELYAYFIEISNDMVSEDYFDEIFQEMDPGGSSVIGQTLSYNDQLIYESDDPQDPFNQSIGNSLTNDKFVLGVRWNNDVLTTSQTWRLLNHWLDMSLYIEFTAPTQQVTVDQKRESNQLMSGTQVSHWENNDFEDYIVPIPSFEFNTGDPEILRGLQGYVTNPTEKYNRWVINNITDDPDVKNHHVFTIGEDMNVLTSKFKQTYSSITIKNSLEGTTLIGGNIQFFEPWYIDFQDGAYGNNWRNRGMEEPHQFYNRSVGTNGWQPDFTTVYQQGPYPYNGVFLNQDYNIPGNPYYKVGMLTEQTISVNGQSRKFYPYKWTGSGVTFQDEYARQTGIVFTSTNATATAVLKGQLMSNTQNGISSASQRKIVRTDNGQYHVVYESMGTVWYTYSLTNNFYGSWKAEELLHTHGKNPSIDYEGNTVKIVFEYYDPQVGGNAKIHLVTYELGSPMDYEEVTSYPNSYYGNAKPVISYTQWEVFIAYRTGPTGAIKQRTKWSDALTWWWGNEADIPGTNADCINPSVTGFRQPGNTTFVHIAYENFGAIYFREAYRIAASWTYSSAPVNLSARSGFNLNRYPVISLSNNSANRYLMVSWQGIYNGTPTNPLPKIDGTDPLYREAAVVKTGYGTSWSTPSSFSNNVDYTSNSSLNTLYGSIMTWSESDGEFSKYVRRRIPTGYDPITSLSNNGIHTLVSNGTEFVIMKAMVFDKSTNAPYFLNRCTDDFTYIPDELGKISEAGIIDIGYGRSGIVEKNGVEFVFNIGDVLLDGETIKFIERVDTLPVTSIEELNASVKTDTLSLNPQSELIFSDYYYVVNSEKADSLLSNDFSINFKCELVKLSTGEVVGEFEEVNYNKSNLEEYGYQGYLIDCSGIETGDYYLRLTSSVNEEVGLSLSDIQMDNVVLEKSKLNVRNFKGSSIPLEYALEQNYPNPFNPATTIRFQLPKDGMVTLKVYDILGAEVKTLVNEEKIAGKYEVSFNASSLASGVYIYRLQANEYISVKKMVMLK